MNIVEDTTQVISQSVTYCQGIHASIASNPWDPFQLYFLYKPAFERIKKLGKDRSFFFVGGELWFEFDFIPWVEGSIDLKIFFFYFVFEYD